ncbi:type VII secretion protein EccCa [Actinomyces howellii]|uniref:DNA segregation ATPase FtsK/SpoIIIE and related proteins n=1 Tax=Actinomyces howellii TaxID=52771 RepID=A0A448HI62_9ACTO|nr:type VII secretion protein EccCa [Actinomyces howellii]VEG29064.1 DNA segregation ATPase FtsK/SpoIIIE and related proteins [Actinomyces howellii]
MIRVIDRPERGSGPTEAPSPVILPSPPAHTGTGSGQLMPVGPALTLVGAGSALVVTAVARSNVILVVLAALVAVGTAVGLLVTVTSRRGTQARQRREQRTRYLRSLMAATAELERTAQETRRGAHLTHPGPSALPAWAIDPARRWARRRTDPDFLLLRAGTADLHLPLAAMPPQADTAAADPQLLAQARAVVRAHAVQEAMPALIDLDGAGQVSIVGPRELARDLARTLLVQAAVHHSPQDLHIALAHDEPCAPHWDCVSRLPHLTIDGSFDGPVASRRVAADQGALEEVLGPEIAAAAKAAAERRRTGTEHELRRSTRLLVVLDTDRVSRDLAIPDSSLGAQDIGATVIHLLTDASLEPAGTRLRLALRRDGTVEVSDPRASEGPGSRPRVVLADRLGPALAEGVSRALAPLRVPRTTQAADPGRSTATLLGLGDPGALDPERAWAPRPARDFLRVPIGTDDTGRPVLLDLKEAAQLGVGPHGLCVGATGSGKSELMRTLVTALAAGHRPEDLTMVLVDVKGGATFAPFAGLPHVVGLIDHLVADPGLARRARTAIAGEVMRRQEQLRQAGSPDISHYRLRRADHPEMPPLAHQLIIIDGLGELLDTDPDFAELLLTIGRIGRAVGVHLLLTSQHLPGAGLRDLDAYLSYRIVLRTFSEAESVAVLGRPDAFHLPATPGYGYLSVDTSVYTRLRAAHVSAPVEQRAPSPEPEEVDEPVPVRLPVFNGLSPSERRVGPPPASRRPGLSVLEQVVSRLRDDSRRGPQVWLPPLPRALPLPAVYGAPLDRGPHGVTAPGRVRSTVGLTVPVGLLDDPSYQRQVPWVIDLGARGGHVCLVGAPQSGRTTFLWTLAVSAALTVRPERLTFYGLDAIGGSMAHLKPLPNVAEVATRGDRARMRRVLDELASMLDHRERILSAHRIDSLEMLREQHAAGRLPGLASADVVVLVDGAGVLRADFPELVDSLDELVHRGRRLGVHVVMTVSRPEDLPPALQPLVGTRLELRLSDPATSLISPELSRSLPLDAPGRVLRPDGLIAQVALPVEDAVGAQSVASGLDRLALELHDTWDPGPAASVRLLPSQPVSRSHRARGRAHRAARSDQRVR